MSFRLSLRKPTTIIYAVALILLLVAGGLWWEKVSTDPQRVFWDTVSQSLQTTGVTVSASQKTSATSADQNVRFSLGADRSESLTTLTQGTTKVVDETYGTPTSDYTRYISIHTDQKSTSGKTLDFSTILGQWAKSDSSAASGGSSVVLLPQAVLGTGLPLGGLALPIANLTPHLRGQLIEQIRDQNVYQISFNKVQKAHQNGRLVYTYDASIQPILYASMMKNFGKVVGLHNFDQLDPNNYSGQPALKVKLTIDVRAHHLVSIVAADGAIKQKYSGYDIPLSMPPPTHTITATQLQQRLTQLQK